VKTQLHIAVIGAGVFGSYHARKFAAHPRAKLVGICDRDDVRAQEIARHNKTQAFSSFEAIQDRVDAVVIAVPAVHHGDVALQALRAGKHVLIEKPIAATLSGARAICTAAKTAGTVLQIGHQERFVLRAIGVYDVTDRPLAIHTRRFSPYTPRGTDVSVTLDLMVHDLDMVLSLMGPASDIKGEARAVCSATPDMAYGIVNFTKGRARLETSRVALTSERIMDIIYPKGSVKIDFNAKTIDHDTPYRLNQNYADDPQATDALGAADDAFIRACLDGDAIPITGEDGLAALQAALTIDGTI